MEDPPSDADTEVSLIHVPTDAVHVMPADVVVVSGTDHDGEIQGNHDLVEVSDSDHDVDI